MEAEPVEVITTHKIGKRERKRTCGGRWKQIIWWDDPNDHAHSLLDNKPLGETNTYGTSFISGFIDHSFMAIHHSAPHCPFDEWLIRLLILTGPSSNMCLFFNRLFFQRPCLQLPLCWPYYRTGHHYTKMSKRMRELWLAQTGARPQCDELLAHTPVPDGYDRARYKGSGLSSHLRLHLTKIKQEKPNKCCRWLGSIFQAWLAWLSAESTFLLHLDQVHV